MTVHDLLAYAEDKLRNDKEYWEEMDRLRGEIEQLVYRQRMIMGAAIIRLAISMVTERSTSKCVDCTGGYSNHAIDLYITVDPEGTATLHILTAHEDIWIPLRDIADLMREKWAEANDELPEL